MDANSVRKLLKAEIKAVGNAAQWARRNKISPAYVCDVLSGRREPGKSILVRLGLERIETYRRKDASEYDV